MNTPQIDTKTETVSLVILAIVVVLTIVFIAMAPKASEQQATKQDVIEINKRLQKIEAYIKYPPVIKKEGE